MITVNWHTKEIFVPKSYLTVVSITPFEILSLDINQFRLDLRSLEADLNEGSSYLKTHTHNSPITVGGVTLARVVEIVSGYTVTFEDGAYRVNLNGGNNNIADVVNLNQVQVRSSNSAGLTDNSSDGIITAGDINAIVDGVWNKLLTGAQVEGTSADMLVKLQSKLDELWKIHGLDSENPMTVTPTNRNSGHVDQTLTSTPGETHVQRN